MGCACSGGDQTMTAPVLGDALGPRGRRRVAVVSVATGAVIAALVAVAVVRLADKGQLDRAQWEPLTRWSQAGVAGAPLRAMLARITAIR